MQTLLLVFSSFLLTLSFLFTFPVAGVIFELTGQKYPASSASFTQMASNFVRFVHSARYVYLCSCEGYPVQPRPQGASPWLPSLHTKTMWTMKAKSINAGGRSKRNRPWFFASLRSKRFQSSYCAKVRAEAKKRVFLLLSRLSRRTSRGDACYAG